MPCNLSGFERFCSRWKFGVPVLVGTVALAAFLSYQGAHLHTDIAPQGVMSLELAGDEALARAIVESWEKKGLLQKAEVQVLWDLPFILLYAALLFHFGLWASRRALCAGERVLGWAARIAAWGGLLAGVFDLLEDWGLWCELHASVSNAVAARTSFCATTKFALIAVALAVPPFVAFARHDFTMPFSWRAMFRIARAIVGALAVVALGLLVPPQTRDTLAGMACCAPREAWSGVAFQLSLFLLAFSAWHWSRAAVSAWFEVGSEPDERAQACARAPTAAWRSDTDPTPLEWAPRLLFVAGAAIGLIAALRSEAWWHAAAIVIWAATALYVLHHRLDWGLYWSPPAPWLDRLDGIGNLFRRAPLGAYPAIALFALAALAFVAALVGSLFPSSGILNFFVRWIAWAFPGPSAVLLFLALALGPLTVLTYFADRLRWGARPFGLEWLIRPPVFLVLLAIVLIVPSLVDLHAVRVARSHAIAVKDRASLDELFGVWFETCVTAKPLDTDGKIIVRPVIVAISGGASRAGLWGARVLVEADAAAAAGGTGIFAISSVSGGSLGAAAYLATLAGQKDSSCRLAQENRTRFRDDALAAIGADALGPALAGALFGDIPRALFGISLTVARHARAALQGIGYEDSRGGDRAEGLERAFERNWSAEVRGALAADPSTGTAGGPLSFSCPFLMLAYDPGRKTDRGTLAPRGGPLWVANGTDAQNGERILTVPFGDSAWLFTGALDALGLIDQDVPISTAVNNTSRFPFLSPAGELSPVPDSGGAPRAYAAQLIDGGYFENEGLLTAWELASHLEKNGPAMLKRDDVKVQPVLVEATADGFRLTPRGRPFMRTIAACFDSYVESASSGSIGV